MVSSYHMISSMVFSILMILCGYSMDHDCYLSMTKHSQKSLEYMFLVIFTSETSCLTHALICGTINCVEIFYDINHGAFNPYDPI